MNYLTKIHKIDNQDQSDIRQCQIIRPHIQLSGKKNPDIRQGIPDNPAGYSTSGKMSDPA